MTVPSHIGQYRIVRKIGAGGMGVVYLGEHRLLGRRAAIKTLLPTVAANGEIVERFFNEARATAAITDPGVIQIFDFGYHVDGTAYIVMELLEGEALSARLDRLGRLALGDALRFARQIAGSLAAAHLRDIIHRDLKPENIFLVQDAEAQGGERTKIIDFGVCKIGAGDPALTEVGAMIGTPVYMSPEQCRGTGEVDQRSDIYAFGCLVFHLLAGRPPFLGDASADLVAAHLQTEPPRASQYAPELPPAVDALLERCLAKAPADRFASMAELLVALGELAETAESAGPPVAGPPPTVPLGRGFRSMYDANMAAALGASLAGSTIGQGLRERLRFASPPPPRPPTDGALEPPPRRALRTALACALAIGAALALIATPLVLGAGRHRPAGPRSPAAPPVQDAADGPIAPAPGAPALTSAQASAPPAIALPRPVAAGDAGRSTEVAGGSAGPASKPSPQPHGARPARGPRDVPHASATSSPSSPSQRHAAPGPAAPGTRTSRPVTSPKQVPAPPVELPAASPAGAPAPAEVPPAALSAPTSAPARPPTAPPPPTEDLYDTR